MGLRLAIACVIAAGAMSATAVTAAATVPGPNGRIAFVSDRDGDPEIYTIDPDGTDLFQVTRNSFDENGPSWSPDGTKIAFSAVRDGNTDIYTVGADGQGEKRITFSAATDLWPSWGPGGRALAWRRVFPNYSQSGIFIVDLETGGATKVTNTLNAHSPSWHPSGDRLLTADGAAMRTIFLTEDGYPSQPLGEPRDLSVADPSYAPDGKRAIYQLAEDTSYGWKYAWGVFDSGGHHDYNQDVRIDGVGWAPGGDRVIYSLGGDLFTANPDASAAALLFAEGTATQPDWGTGPTVQQDPGGPQDPGPPQDPQPPGPLPGPCANAQTGTDGKDKLTGTAFGDRLRGGKGDDTLSGAAEADCLFGDSGDDKLKGGDGNDELDGGKGNDKLTAGAGADKLTGGKGNDRLVGEKNKDSFSGGEGNDSISSRDGKGEKVKCGAGSKDKVTADKKDKVSKDCEKVTRK